MRRQTSHIVRARPTAPVRRRRRKEAIGGSLPRPGLVLGRLAVGALVAVGAFVAVVALVVAVRLRPLVPLALRRIVLLRRLAAAVPVPIVVRLPALVVVIRPMRRLRALRVLLVSFRMLGLRRLHVRSRSLRRLLVLGLLRLRMLVLLREFGERGLRLCRLRCDGLWLRSWSDAAMPRCGRRNVSGDVP